MSRMWKILEGENPHVSYRHSKGMMGDEVEEAFEEGFECGYEEAMEMVAEKYGHMGFRGEGGSSSYRSGSSSRGGSSRGGSSYGNRMGYRDDDEDEEMNERMGYRRRRRDSRGRYM